MAEQDEVPEGLTLITPPTPPSGGGAGTPEGLTEVTPANPQHGIFLNPGGDKVTGLSPSPTGEIYTPEPVKGVQDFVFNRVPGSVGSFISNTLHAAIHPIDTGTALGNLIAGGFKIGARQLGVDFPENESDQVARAFGHYVASRYSSLDKAKEALYNDPVGVLADFSTLATTVGGIPKLAEGLVRIPEAVATAAKAGRTAEALDMAATSVGAWGNLPLKVGEVTNPAWLPGKIATRPIRRYAPKLPAGGFDPSTATFEGGEAAPAAPAAPQATQDAIRQRAYEIGQQRSTGDQLSDWLQAEKEIRNPTPTPAPVTSPSSPVFTKIKSTLSGMGLGLGLEQLLTHHFAGAIGTGLAAGAIKYLPVLLKSPEGQQMLARIGPNSTSAQVAAAVRDTLPALNALYRQQQQKQPITINPSPFARGGMFNPELVRLQRSRLPGILETLDKRK